MQKLSVVFAPAANLSGREIPARHNIVYTADNGTTEIINSAPTKAEAEAMLSELAADMEADNEPETDTAMTADQLEGLQYAAACYGFLLPRKTTHVKAAKLATEIRKVYDSQNQHTAAFLNTLAAFPDITLTLTR